MSRCPAGCQWGLDEQILVGGLLGGLTELARAVPYESRSLFELRITVQLWGSEPSEPSEPIGVTSVEYVPICVLQYMRDLG